MNISYRILQNKIPSFNRRAHDREDFRRFLRALDCELVERRQRRPGYYVTDESGDVVFIDSRIRGHHRREVEFHELTHAILDYPCDFLEFRQQLRAEIFALVFMIPRGQLFELMRTPFEMIDHRLIPYLKRRKFVWERFGI